MGFDDKARASIDALIFISQQPDYFFPATAGILQHRLGLANAISLRALVNGQTPKNHD